MKLQKIYAYEPDSRWGNRFTNGSVYKWQIDKVFFLTTTGSQFYYSLSRTVTVIYYGYKVLSK